jgi:hypothetical protein
MATVHLPLCIFFHYLLWRCSLDAVRDVPPALEGAGHKRGQDLIRTACFFA